MRVASQGARPAGHSYPFSVRVKAAQDDNAPLLHRVETKAGRYEEIL